MAGACGHLCIALLVVMTTLRGSSGSPVPSLPQPGTAGHGFREQSNMAAVERESRITRIASDYFRRKSASSSMRRHWHVMGQAATSPPDLVLVLLAGAGGNTTDSLYWTAAAVDHVLSTDPRLSLSFPIICNLDPHPDLNGPAQEVKGHLPSVQRFGMPPPPGVAFHPEVLRHHNDTSHWRHEALDLAFCLQVALSYRPRNLLLLREDALDHGTGEPASAVSIATGVEPLDLDPTAFIFARDATLVGRRGLTDGKLSDIQPGGPDLISKGEYDEISAPLRDIIHKLWTGQISGLRDIMASSATLFPRQPRTASLNLATQSPLPWDLQLSVSLCLWVVVVTGHVVWSWWRRTPPDGRFLLLAACLVLALHLLPSQCGLWYTVEQQDRLGMGVQSGDLGQDLGFRGQTGHKWTLRAVFLSSPVAERLATQLAEEWDGQEPLDTSIVKFVQGLNIQNAD